MRKFVGLIAGMLLGGGSAVAAELSVRAGDGARSTAMTLAAGEEAAIEILVTLEEGERLGFASVFPSVGPFDDGPEFFEAVDFLSEFDPATSDYPGHQILITRAESGSMPFDFGEGIYWNEYVLIMNTTGVEGPGVFMLERLIIHGLQPGTTTLALNGSLSELFAPDNGALVRTFSSRPLRITVTGEAPPAGGGSTGGSAGGATSGGAAGGSSGGSTDGDSTTGEEPVDPADDGGDVVPGDGGDGNPDDGGVNGDTQADNGTDGDGSDEAVDGGGAGGTDPDAEVPGNDGGDNTTGGSADGDATGDDPTTGVATRPCGLGMISTLMFCSLGMAALRVKPSRRGG